MLTCFFSDDMGKNLGNETPKPIINKGIKKAFNLLLTVNSENETVSNLILTSLKIRTLNTRIRNSTPKVMT